MVDIVILQFAEIPIFVKVFIVILSQHRTRSLVDGYEYLQGLSTQLPEMFVETANSHRKTLQDAIHSLSDEDQANIAIQEKILQKVRGELQSISHERVIMNVLMRPAITETKRIYAQAQSVADKVTEKRYQQSGGRGSGGATGANVTENRNLHSSNTSGTTTSTSSSALPQRTNRSATMGVTFNATAELLNTPIHIPQYNPTQAQAQAQTQVQGQSLRPQQLPLNQQQPGLEWKYNSIYETHNQVLSSGSSRVLARAVGGGLMVSIYSMLQN